LDRGNSRIARQASSKLTDVGSSSTAAIGFEAEGKRQLSVVEELEAVVTTNLKEANRLWLVVLLKAFAVQFCTG
jgi:hypothetical protein